MPQIRFTEPSGGEKLVEIASGVSLMHGALEGGVEGIDADCGGCLSCATCHVYVDPAFLARIDPPADDEREMLGLAAAEVRPNSRLSCQIVVAPELDGLHVEIPETQI